MQALFSLARPVAAGVFTAATCSAAASLASSENSSSSLPEALDAVFSEDRDAIEAACVLPPKVDTREYAVEQVIIVHRHGDRAPIGKAEGTLLHQGPGSDKFWASKLPSEEHCARLDGVFPVSSPMGAAALSEHDTHSAPFGQLTSRGAAQLLALGRALRAHYAAMDALPDSLGPEDVSARSTLLRRCVLSAQHLLLGLLPPGSLAPPKGPVQPLEEHPDFSTDPARVAVRVPSPDRDTQFSWTCAKASALVQGGRAALTADRSPGVAEVAVAVERASGVRTADADTLGLRVARLHGLREVAVCCASHGVPLPPGLAAALPRLGGVCAAEYASAARTAAGGRLLIGRFVADVADEIAARALSVVAEPTQVTAAGGIVSAAFVHSEAAHGRDPWLWFPHGPRTRLSDADRVAVAEASAAAASLPVCDPDCRDAFPVRMAAVQREAAAGRVAVGAADALREAPPALASYALARGLALPAAQPGDWLRTAIVRTGRQLQEGDGEASMERARGVDASHEGRPGDIVPYRAPRRLAVFSGHDSTVIPMLTALGVFDDEWPEYAAYVELLLLRKKATGDLCVRVAYKGKTLKQVGIGEFFEAVQKLAPATDAAFEEECQAVE